jgi:hypothetical protein
MRRGFAILIACGLAAGLAGCPQPAAPQATSPADDGGVGTPDDGAAAEPSDDGAPAASSGCTTTADCPADHVCEGEGCEAGGGTCEPTDRMCTRDYVAYCGCDGETFHGSGGCPNARFAHRGEC